jgi:hypothetical protein
MSYVVRLAKTQFNANAPKRIFGFYERPYSMPVKRAY